MPDRIRRSSREDVVAVARRRDSGVTLAQIAKDFGISVQTLTNWLKRGRYRRGSSSWSDEGLIADEPRRAVRSLAILRIAGWRCQ